MCYFVLVDALRKLSGADACGPNRGPQNTVPAYCVLISVSASHRHFEKHAVKHMNPKQAEQKLSVFSDSHNLKCTKAKADTQRCETDHHEYASDQSHGCQ